MPGPAHGGRTARTHWLPTRAADSAQDSSRCTDRTPTPAARRRARSATTCNTGSSPSSTFVVYMSVSVSRGPAPGARPDSPFAFVESALAHAARYASRAWRMHGASEAPPAMRHRDFSSWYARSAASRSCCRLGSLLDGSAAAAGARGAGAAARMAVIRRPSRLDCTSAPRVLAAERHSQYGRAP